MKVHLWTYYKRIDLQDKNAPSNFDAEKRSDVTFEPIGNYPDYYYHFAPQLSIHTGSNNLPPALDFVRNGYAINQTPLGWILTVKKNGEVINQPLEKSESYQLAAKDRLEITLASARELRTLHVIVVSLTRSSKR